MPHVSAPSLDAAGQIFVDPRRYADPAGWHAVAAQLRRDAPVFRVAPEGHDPFYAVTRHADVFEIERQHERFLNTDDSVLFPRGAIDRLKATGAFVRTLIHMDGDQHRDYRMVANDWFKPANLRRTTEPRVRTLARQFVDRMQARGDSCDFAADIALFYPLHVIMSILGVPESDETRMLRLTQQLFGSGDPEFGGGDPEQARASALMDFAMYFQHLTQDRRSHPGSDLASTLANGSIAGAPLGDLETIGYYVIIATAGHDTTSNALAGGLEALVRHPTQLRALQEDPALIDGAVDEIIRWVSPVRHFLRYAQDDYTLAGVDIRAGERLLLSYLSANHDDAVFDQPFRFDAQRRNADQHLAFGTGAHFCLGAHLSRMELRAFFRELLPRLDTIALADEPEYVEANFVGGLKRLPVRYAIRSAAN